MRRTLNASSVHHISAGVASPPIQASGPSHSPEARVLDGSAFISEDTTEMTAMNRAIKEVANTIMPILLGEFQSFLLCFSIFSW